MTSEPVPMTVVEDVLRDWLHEQQPVLSDAALDMALREAWGTRRRTGWSRHRGWLLVAAAALFLGLVAGLVVAGMSRPWALFPDRPAPTDSPAVTGPPVSIDPEAVRGVWYSVGGADEPGAVWLLRLNDLPTLERVSDRTYLGLGATSIAGDVLAIAALPGGPCADQPGAFRVALADEPDRTLRLTVVDDACAERVEGLTRLFHRVPDDWVLADRFRLPFLYQADDGKLLFENTDRMHLLAPNDGVDQAAGLGIWIVQEVFDDVCRGTERRRVEPGTAAFIEHLRSVPELDVEERPSATIGDRPATVLRLTRRPGACEGGFMRVWNDIGREDGDPRDDWFAIPPGGSAEVAVLDVGGEAVVIAAWALEGVPPLSDSQRAFRDRIRFIQPPP